MADDEMAETGRGLDLWAGKVATEPLGRGHLQGERGVNPEKEAHIEVAGPD